LPFGQKRQQGGRVAVQWRGADRCIDIGVTLLCWLYFTLGFVILFAPLYLVAWLCSKTREQAFQRYNRKFYRTFFFLLQTMTPRHRWILDDGIKAIRSSVVLCNHTSYLDPLLLIALLEQSKTVIKPSFFAVPVFSWVLRIAGYFPATVSGKYGGLMLTQMESMPSYLASGGNLFIFPEGTRNRGAGLAELNRGALKMALHCRAPIYVLCLQNTDKLFIPGKFVFSTRVDNAIRLRIVDRIDPDEKPLSVAMLHDRVRQSLLDSLSASEAGPRPDMANP
jgi:1-acyl-sn-glycerol-3-phosphate acyltransferase